MSLSYLQLNFEPHADPQAMVYGSNIRFTVLTSRLIRIEHSLGGEFEDRPSQVFWFRRQPVPEFEVIRSGDRIEIVTEHLHLRFQPDVEVVGDQESIQVSAGEQRWLYVLHENIFTRTSLSIELKTTGTLWHYGDVDPQNLRGTARTLDEADGAIRLEPGLMSRTGWAVIDDSHSLMFDESGWLSERTGEGIDLYFFGYGHDYVQCLKDYCKVAGPMPLIPRWALGNWWSRYWEYTQDELIDLMREFEARKVPLAVCIVDMDWHITQTGNVSSGWTGYTWNRDLFPEPELFIDWLHAHGLKTALNLHPAQGVHPHEAMYEELARYIGMDLETREPVAFDIVDPKFTEGYFEILHHPLEAQGVDFWWMDWQQGQRTRLRGLDPLWWLNHLHFYDLSRDGKKRPFVFSRWGGLGNHRYPIGFSGDTHVTWASLAFQPYFTSTAANVGYGWWSHDIGGHHFGVEDAELYTRWVQFGVFSPIFRLHSTKNAYQDRRPWGFGAEVFRIACEAMQLRHALIPYLYSMAWRNTQESIPLITPMYYAHPNCDEAYECPQQYMFGSELLVAPFTHPRDDDTQLSRQNVWLPAGDWFNFFSGEHIAGDRWYVAYGALDEVPVFAKAGAIVPLGPKVGWGGIDAPDALTVHIFAGATNRFTLYEDDGESPAYQQGHTALTEFVQTWAVERLEFTIAAVDGDVECVPSRRHYTLTVHGIKQPAQIALYIDDRTVQIDWSYDAVHETLTFGAVTLDANSALRLSVRADALLSKRDRTIETCRKLLKAFRLESNVKARIDANLAQIVDDVRLLAQYRELKDAHIGALRQVIERVA